MAAIASPQTDHHNADYAKAVQQERVLLDEQSKTDTEKDVMNSYDVIFTYDVTDPIT